MFANLKKKIQEEHGDRRLSGPGLASPVNRIAPQRAAPPVAVHSSPAPSPLAKNSAGDQTHLRRNDSVSSMGSSHDSSQSSANSKEEVLAMLMKRTDQVKKLESKISEYASTIKEKVKMIEKLEQALEKQTDASLKRVQEINEQQQASRAKLSEGFTLALQKKEEEMAAFVLQVQKEKAEMDEKLKEAESYKEKYYKTEEANDELQGLTSQELAKVKHLLLNREEELSSCRSYLQEKMTLLETATENVSQLESSVKSKQEELSSLTESKNRLELENESLQENVSKLQSSLLELNSNFEEKSSRLSTLESSLSDLQHEHTKLERTSEVYKNKTTSLLEEKESHITHLEDRVKTLEQRLHDSELSGDEKTMALHTERTHLEQKLAEARQQLTEIKTSWSEKINHLEQQIAHLNSKIVEDSEELLSCQRSAEATRESLQKQVETLRTSLEEASKRASAHLETVKEKEAVIDRQSREFEMERARLSQHSMDSDTELRAKITALESEVLQLETVRDTERRKAEERISQLEASESDFLQKEIEHEQAMSKAELDSQQRLDSLETEWRLKVESLEGEKQNLVTELGRKERECSVTLGILEETRSEVTQLREKMVLSDSHVTGAKEKVTEYSDKVNALQEELQAANDEKDGLLVRNAELSQEMKKLQHSGNEKEADLQSEVKRLSAVVDESQQTIAKKEDEIKVLMQQLSEADSQQREAASAMHAGELQNYERVNADLELQLTEKNKTIKMLQQRLGDLKKTLQRELKVQALPNDEHRVEGRDLEVARLSVSTSDAVDGVPQPQKHSMTGARNSAAQHLNVHVGASEGRFMNGDDMRDVNFEYLKHVVLKFMLSREAEAIHLIKAVSVLLDFSPDEEKLIKQTLEYKMSWFGRAPSLGKGQKTRAIPPTF